VAEWLLPPSIEFDARIDIGIKAPPEAVWRALLDMPAIDPPSSLPFRLGVAYPVRGEVLGEGVGALRRGTFSTGTAVERITVWNPGRKLAFVVVSDDHLYRYGGWVANCCPRTARRESPSHRLFARRSPPATFIELFRGGLRELGYVEGESIIIEYGIAEKRLASELLTRSRRTVAG
jgi:hypothetical protein